MLFYTSVSVFSCCRDVCHCYLAAKKKATAAASHVITDTASASSVIQVGVSACHTHTHRVTHSYKMCKPRPQTFCSTLRPHFTRL